MRVLFVLGSFFPAQSGGPNNSVFQIARELSRGELDVDVASFDEGLSCDHVNEYSIVFGKKTEIDGVGIFFFRTGFSRLVSFRIFFWLFKNISNYTVVNLSSVFLPLSVYCACLCILKGKKFTIAPRGELEPGALKFSSNKKFFAWLFLKRIYRKCLFVWATSNMELESCRTRIGDSVRIEVVPNYFDVRDYPFSSGYAGDVKSILYLGRIHQKKGIEILFNSVRLLPDDLKKKVKVVVAGCGLPEYENQLKLLAQDVLPDVMVEFIGHVVGDVKANVYGSSCVFVLPSFSENFGNVIVESLACGTPVVVSVNTPWESLNGTSFGMCVELDPAVLCCAIERFLILDESAMRSARFQARHFVERNFDVQGRADFVRGLFGDG